MFNVQVYSYGVVCMRITLLYCSCLFVWLYVMMYCLNTLVCVVGLCDFMMVLFERIVHVY